MHLRIKYSAAIIRAVFISDPSPRGDDAFEDLRSLTCGAAMEGTFCTSFSLNSVSSLFKVGMIQEVSVKTIHPQMSSTVRLGINNHYNIFNND